MHSLAVYQLKGGVGKTTTAVNLAALAARDGWPTLLWDLDPQGAAGHVLGADPAGIKVKKLLRGEQAAGRLVEHTPWRHLDVLPSNRKLRNVDAHLGSGHTDGSWVQTWLKRFSENYRLVVIDCPPALGGLAESILRNASLLLLPTEPGPLARRAVDQVREHLEELGIKNPPLRTFFNQVDRRRRMHREMAEDPSQFLPFASPVTIPASAAVERMGMECAPLYAYAGAGHPAVQAFDALWQDTRKVLEKPGRKGKT
ncbi:ParA family protein [Algiphilus sp.]|uniref:ParA family protein n=1 Tax=Algiphilus sp. TaxID=1872431 RepID=UPI0032F01290